MEKITKQQLAIILRYCVVGGSGTILDLGLLYALVEYARFDVILASIISFAAATGNNFYWNKRWTFGDRSPRVIKQYTKFAIVSLLGLGLNTLLLATLVHLLGVWYIGAKLCATLVILVWNFTMNKFWTFREYGIPRPTVESRNECDLTVVIPAYNEEATLSKTLTEIVTYCAQRNFSYEVLIVDDGSRDATNEIAREFSAAHPRFCLITHEHNLGKGASVRDGMIAARGRYVLFMDADGATPIGEFDTFLPWFQKGFAIVIGSRYLSTSSILIAQAWYRVLLGRLGNLLIRTLLLEGISDTQCGFKAFTYEAAHAITPRQSITGWGFDMEILSIGRQMGYAITEVPVTWKNALRKSRFRPLIDAHRTFKDLFIIKFNLMTRRYHSAVIHEGEKRS